MGARPVHCAIDFGTSNSAVALPSADDGGVQLVVLEDGFTGMPTAVFYAVEGLASHQQPQRLHGRAAIAAYVEGTEGRLMRSMKSILGSSLVERSTDVGGGHSVRYLDVIGSYLLHLKDKAEAAAAAPIDLNIVEAGLATWTPWLARMSSRRSMRVRRNGPTRTTLKSDVPPPMSATGTVCSFCTVRS